MRIRLITICQKTPTWIQAGFAEYIKRLPAHFTLELLELPAEKRHASTPIAKSINREGEKLLAQTKPQHTVIALDANGRQWNSEQLAHVLKSWQDQGQPVDLLVGGADGLSPACLARAQHTWSLSALTFPHQLVKLIVAEQIYRAYTILHHHPYHR